MTIEMTPLEEVTGWHRAQADLGDPKFRSVHERIIGLLETAHAQGGGTMRKFWHYAAIVALVVAGYSWGLRVQATADRAVMDQHLADDSIDNETVWEICTPRPAQEQPR